MNELLIVAPRAQHQGITLQTAQDILEDHGYFAELGDITINGNTGKSHDWYISADYYIKLHS